MESSSDHLGEIKILMLGDMAVGKTSLVLRFTDDKFDYNYMMTLGIEFRSKILKLKKGSYLVEVQDTAGQERFRVITKSYFRKACGILLAYDMTNRKSFEGVKVWLNQIHSIVDSNIPIALASTKSDDVNRMQVSTQEGEALAKQLGFMFFETSSKNNTGVAEAYTQLSLEIERRGLVIKNTSSIKIVKEKEKTKKKCCKSQ